VDGSEERAATSQRVPRRPWGPTAPSGPWDAIVVGGGMGGLAAAGMLAQLGRRVLVLEQHAIPGGFTQGFRRGHWGWDVGLHVVGEMGPVGLAGRVLHGLTGGRLAWTRIDGAYDLIELPDGQQVEIPGSVSALSSSLERAFPRERKAVRSYLQRTREAAAALRDYFAARSLTPWMDRGGHSPSRELALARTADVLAATTGDERLRAVLAAHWGYYGAPPSRSVFGVHAMLARHYWHGAYYPQGGAMSIARAMSAELAARGGWVRVRADVEQILVQHGRAVGVRLGSGEEIRARAVIGASGAHNTLRLLPDDERRQEWAESIQALPQSCAHVCLYLGFRGDIRAAGATPTNRWLLSNLREDLWNGRDAHPSIYVSFPSLKDGADHSDGFHTAEVLALTSWEVFERFQDTHWRKRGPDYEQLKAAISGTLLFRLLEHLPGLRPLIAYQELSTPLSTAHFTRGVRGAAYGLEVNRNRFLNPYLRPRTPVRGLVLAGSDVAVVGVVGALVGGLAAATSIEPERARAWLRQSVRSRSEVSRSPH
jgi:all-trans-retinol 13,14-reductase